MSVRKSPSMPARQATARTRRAPTQTAPLASILRMSLMTKSSLLKADDQSKIEPENKATNGDAGHRMKRLEEQVAALKTTTIRQEAGATRPYPVEWDTVKYPSRFKVPNLNTFDGKGSAQQYIYYFQSQTRSLMGNDPVRTQLLISTLKGVAFEWFRKLPKGSVTCWDDLDALFISRFFE